MAFPHLTNHLDDVHGKPPAIKAIKAIKHSPKAVEDGSRW